MSDVLTTLPTGGMSQRQAKDCDELLRLATVMGWTPKIPLEIMRDDDAGRWFMRGPRGKQDYWIRDSDIQTLKQTPMWDAVRKAAPYGSFEKPAAKTEFKIEVIEAEVAEEGFAEEADPVEQDRLDRAQERLAAEERFHKWDDWE